MTTANSPAAQPPAADGNPPHAQLQEILLAGGGTFALITLGIPDGARPATLGPESLLELGALLDKVKDRVASGEIVGLGLTGRDRCFVAGADLNVMRRINDPESARTLASLGHEVLGTISAMDVPTFAFINGAAIGGGLEIALAAGYRTISADAVPVSLPEAFLGLVPGWGGVYCLPRLVGPENAVKIMIENALSNNRTLDGPSAFDLGIADAIFDPTDFLEQSLAWAGTVIAGHNGVVNALEVRRKENADYTAADWDDAVARGRIVVQTRLSNATPAPGRLLDLLESGRNLSRTESAHLEIDALTELMQTSQFQNSVYAFLDLLQRRARNSAVITDPELARSIGKVGVVGAGLMAGQLAVLFARQLRVPVVLTDIDRAHVDKGLSYVHAEVNRLLAKQRMTPDDAARTTRLVTGSVSKDAFADADFVIEAVFEELSVKKQVFAELEAVVSPECILATNTSSLSVSEMAAGLRHPGRVVGLHFFNPVAGMPLVEVIPAAETQDEVIATAIVLGQALGKSTVLVQDSAAFVVNRVLLRLLGEVSAAFDEGTPAHIADSALKPMGLPMTPFSLLAMIGPPVSLHVARSLNAAFGDRFPVSANQQTLIDHGITSLWATNADGTQSIPARTLKLLEFSDTPSTRDELLIRVQDALAEEIALMLDEGVVSDAQDIDLCMLTGAGWPLHLGGITPYLDQTGASERANGRLFHPASVNAQPSAISR